MTSTTRRTVLVASAGTLAALAGCSGGSGESNEFRISSIVFAASEPGGYGDYDQQPDATYEPGETVWLYFEVKDISVEENDDGTKEVWVVEHLHVETPDGETLIDEELVNDHRDWDADIDVQERLFLTNNISVGVDPATGDYTVDITVTDRLAERETTATTTFTVE